MKTEVFTIVILWLRFTQESTRGDPPPIAAEEPTAPLQASSHKQATPDAVPPAPPAPSCAPTPANDSQRSDKHTQPNPEEESQAVTDGAPLFLDSPVGKPKDPEASHTREAPLEGVWAMPRILSIAPPCKDDTDS